MYCVCLNCAVGVVVLSGCACLNCGLVVRLWLCSDDFVVDGANYAYVVSMSLRHQCARVARLRMMRVIRYELVIAPPSLFCLLKIKLALYAYRKLIKELSKYLQLLLSFSQFQKFN